MPAVSPDPEGGLPASEVNVRRKSRFERAAISAAAALAGRGVQMASALITVPLTLHYLGTERYGVWLTLISISFIAGVLDLGVGNSVLNAVAKADGQRDKAAVRSALSNGLVLSTMASLLSALFLALLAAVVPAEDWVGAPGAASDVVPAIWALAVLLLLGVPVGLLVRAQDGLQEGFWGAGVQIFASLAALAGVVLCVRLNASLLMLTVVVFSPVLVANGACAAWFLRRHRDVAPVRSDVSKAGMRDLLGPASAFLVLQIASVVTYSLDPWIGAQWLGPASVPEFAVPVRLFTMLPMGLGLILNPFWPAYREALATDDREWAWRTLVKTVLLTLLVAVPAVAVFAFWGLKIILVWTSGAIVPSSAVVIASALQVLVMSLATPIAVIMNAVGFLRLQVVLALFLFFGTLLLKRYLVPTFGVAALPATTAACQFVFSVLPALVALYLWRRAGARQHAAGRSHG